jgi:hypothetical protein
MVLSPDSCRAYMYEIPDLVIHREPWHPAWHPGYPELVFKDRPVEPVLTRRRELCAVAAVKRRRHCRPVPSQWVHPWVLDARARCVQTTRSSEKTDN